VLICLSIRCNSCKIYFITCTANICDSIKCSFSKSFTSFF